MDQEKIGRFIAECRKNINLTQMQLAEKLNVTNRAVSKWETGKTMPDSSIMLELCDILHITVNDLLHGEILSPENYNYEVQEQLVELIAQKEHAEKRLLSTTTLLLIAYFILIAFYALIIFFAPINNWHGFVAACLGVIACLLVLIKIRLEKSVGYYQCTKCQHIYVPTYGRMFLADNLTAYNKRMRCPNCKTRTRQNKVFTKK